MKQTAEQLRPVLKCSFVLWKHLFKQLPSEFPFRNFTEAVANLEFRLSASPSASFLDNGAEKNTAWKEKYSLQPGISMEAEQDTKEATEFSRLQLSIMSAQDC